jgi:excisionase family DNA binding protein
MLSDDSMALSARDACRFLGISPSTLYRLTRDGRIPHARIGRRVLYPRMSLEQWLTDRTRGGRR